MGLILVLLLVLLGVLGAANLIVAKRPDAQAAISKLAPYQGWIGVIALLWGIWSLIWLLLHIGSVMGAAPIWAITGLVCCLVMILLGFLLGYPVIMQYVLSKNEEARQKADQLRQKLIPFQAKLGLASIALGIWGLIAQIAFSV